MRVDVKWFSGFILIFFMWACTAESPPPQKAEEETLAEETISQSPGEEEIEGLEDEIVGDTIAGEKLVEVMDCRQCHTIQGDGGAVGPDLTNVRLRRSKQWLVRWFEDPTLIRPSSGMPGFPWESEQEIYDIISYLDTLKHGVDKEKILKEKDLINAGEKLVTAYDCQACHTIGDGGIDIYPDLSKIGQKLRPEWDKKFLKDPSAWNPYTFMPNFHLSDPEIEAIVAYLMSRK
jgi:cytochrome c2